jgi:hypothetical protein
MTELSQEKSIENDSQISSEISNQFGGGNSNINSIQNQKLSLEYLHPADEFLIQPFMKDIIADATQYINNLHSDIMKKYNKFYNLIYDKYSGKKYKIETPLNQIIVYTNDKKKTLIHIHKPEYIKISTKTKIYKDLISKNRIELDNKFYSITHITGGITPTDKDNFLKTKTEFLNILKKYYTILVYKLLRQKLNQNTHNSNNEVVNYSVEPINKQIDISINIPTIELKEISGILEKVPIIKQNIITVPESQVLLKNQYESDKLNQYNEIITLLHSGTKEKDPFFKEKIIEYIDNKNIITFKQSSDTYEDLIITDLPKIINEL